MKWRQEALLCIRTKEEIRRVREGRLLPVAFCEELETYFKEVVENLTGDAEAWATYDLSGDGPLFVLQPGVDNPADLGAAGLPKEFGGLFGAPIEHACLLKLGDLQVFRVLVVANNEYAIEIYAQVGGFGEKLDRHLRRHCTGGETE
jgi:hypothetical protein